MGGKKRRCCGPHVIAPAETAERQDTLHGTLLRQDPARVVASMLVEEGQGAYGVTRMQGRNPGEQEACLGFQRGRRGPDRGRGLQGLDWG